MDSVLGRLHEKVRKALEALGFRDLYEVQKHAVGAVLSGDHVLIVAPTGSGKTEAALLPVLSKMLEEPQVEGVRTVYVTPLRALNRDLGLRVQRLAEAVGLRAMVRHGDTSAAERKEFLVRPPDIMITTPESLNLLLALRDHREIWRNVGWVIVDELQEMLESERGAELAVVLERLSAVSSRRVQRIGLSATLSRRSIGEAIRFLSTTERVRLVRDTEAKRYEFRVEVTGWEEMREKLKDIMEGGQALVFTNTRSLAEEVGALLSAISSDLSQVHHSSLEKRVREEAEREFREGRLRALVATSSMELGIDIGSIETVVQVLSPRQVVRLVQRAGRAGHKRGAVSKAVILTTDNLYEVLESLTIADMAKVGLLEDLKGHKNPYDVLAHQLTAMVVEGSARTLEEALKMLKRAYPFRDLSMEELRAVAEHLDGVKVLKLKEDGSLRMSKRTFEYLHGVTMIPDERFFVVIDIAAEKKVGELSEVYVEQEILPRWVGNRRPKFVLAGRVWEALDIDPEKETILAKPTASLEGLVPYWVGELIPVDQRVAREACSQIATIMSGGRMLYRRLEEVLRETRREWGESFSRGEVIVEEVEEASVVYSCLGSRGNTTLALLLSSLMGMGKVEHSSFPYGIVLDVPAAAVANALRRAGEMSAVERRAAVMEAIKSTRAFAFRFYHVAKRMGVIEAGADLGKLSLLNLAKSYMGTVVERETLRELEHEKLDFEVLESFFGETRAVKIVAGPSPLFEEVRNNPYMKRDVTAKAKELAMDVLLESKKKALLERRVIMTCYVCGKSKEFAVSELGEYRCPSCGSVYVASLPASDEGRRVAEAMRKRAQRKALSKEEEELLRKYKVMELAGLHANYHYHSKQLAMALMTRGVGPEWAKRAMEEFMRGGEKALLTSLLELEERYITTREYWG